MQELIGKEVEVSAEDILYKGVLIEIGETEMYLLSDSGWIVVPVEKIADVRAVD